MKTSCGAILYSFNSKGEIGIVLGLEGRPGDWLPFKGCMEIGETEEQTAIREIREETCGLVLLDNIKLEHSFTSKRKHYKIGLCEVPYSIIAEFAHKSRTENRNEYREKKQLAFFDLSTILTNPNIHNISKASIKYYWNKLMLLDKARNIQANQCIIKKVHMNIDTNIKTKLLNTNKDTSDKAISIHRQWKQSVNYSFANEIYNKIYLWQDSRV